MQLVVYVKDLQKATAWTWWWRTQERKMFRGLQKLYGKDDRRADHQVGDLEARRASSGRPAGAVRHFSKAGSGGRT